jgi:drug/metabolite transporter (DMT)-like permease
VSVLVYLFSFLAAAANAASSVLQRKADRDLPSTHNLSWRLIVDVARQPAFFLGVAGLTLGFLLQAAALGSGPLATVEPILVVELPLTMLIGSAAFRVRLHAREWTATLAITIGLIALLYALSPTGGEHGHVRWYAWVIGIGANVALVLGLVAAARRGGPARRSALLGVATGAGFGLTAALIKAVTQAFAAGGFVSVLTTWQTYVMIVTGGLSVFLLQNALNAGSLVTAQPGFTGADPIVSIVWGVLAFGEQVRTGPFLVLALAGAAVVGWGIARLSQSPYVTGNRTPGSRAQQDDAAANGEAARAAPGR